FLAIILVTLVIVVIALQTQASLHSWNERLQSKLVVVWHSQLLSYEDQLGRTDLTPERRALLRSSIDRLQKKIADPKAATEEYIDQIKVTKADLDRDPSSISEPDRTAAKVALDEGEPGRAGIIFTAAAAADLTHAAENLYRAGQSFERQGDFLLARQRYGE